MAKWTPRGLVQPTVLPFGQKNSGTEAQGPYRAAAASLRQIPNYPCVDDWLRCPNTISDLVMAGLGLFFHLSVRALTPRGLLRSAYDFLCLIYAKNARASWKMPGQF